MGRLRSLILEGMPPRGVYYANKEDEAWAMVNDLSRSRRGGKKRDQIMRDLVGHTYGYGGEGSVFEQLLNAMCDVYGVDLNRMNAAAAASSDFYRKNQTYDTQLQKELYEAYDEIVERFMLIDLRKLPDEMIKRAGKPASEIDWRSSETTPEDYYAV